MQQHLIEFIVIRDCVHLKISEFKVGGTVGWREVGGGRGGGRAGGGAKAIPEQFRGKCGRLQHHIKDPSEFLNICISKCFISSHRHPGWF